MKLATMMDGNGSLMPAVLREQEALDLRPAGFPDLLSFLQSGEEGLERARTLAADPQQRGLPLQQLHLQAPLPLPPRVFGIGLNYKEHAQESNMKVQSVPTVFMKLSSSVTGPEQNIVLPHIAKEPDYEAELAVVIGKGGRRISSDRAMDHVFGYTIANDVSARDVQLATSQWTLGKSFPGFLPLGPVITTKDEVPDPHALAIELSIGGEVLQSSNTSLLIFRIPQLIEYLSSILPLEPGDVILTGTPPGVGLGRDPKRWLRPGEEIVIHIEGLGELRNRTVAEQIGEAQ